MTKKLPTHHTALALLEPAFQHAVTQHQAGRLEEAQSLYRAILQTHPRHPDANHNLGVLAVQMNQTASALPYFQVALDVDPTRGQFWLSYIDALLQAGHLDDARQIFESARQSGLRGNAVEALAARLKTGPSNVPQRDEKNPTPQDINTLVALFNQGRFTEVEALARTMTERFPQSGFGWKALGAVLKQMGRSAEALAPTLNAATLLPNDANAHSNLGAIYQDLGRHAEAEISLRRALLINPNVAEVYYNLGNTLRDLGRLVEAEENFRQALKINPDFAQACGYLGLTLYELHQLDEAESSLRQALQLNPEFAQAHGNLGLTLYHQKRLDEAETCFRRALQINSDIAEVHNNLGNTLRDLGRLNDADASYRRALQIKPDYAAAHYNLGSTLQNSGRQREAEASLRRALQINPLYAEAHNNLGNTLKDLGQLDAAEASYRQALRCAPSLAEAHSNLGVTLMELGRLVEAEASHRKALEIAPNDAHAHQNLATLLAYLSKYDQVVAESNIALSLKPNATIIWEQRLYAFSYHPDLSAQDIYAEFVRWGDRYPDPVVDFSGHDRTPHRRLRVGYVSPDFRGHTSRFFFWPLFANHDHAAVEVFAYSNVRIEDDTTQQFKTVFDHWRNIRGVSDHDVADMIRQDKIDILVDGCNHMRDDRLGVFTLKPAPIQATWLGAAWTTGLKMIDYALIDPYMAPEGTLTRETIVRLPHCFVAYQPPEVTAEIAPPPCLKNGFITFGYSGRTERLNHHTFRVWGEILKQNPTARLILDFRPFADPPTQAHYRQFMLQHGMNPDQVIMRNSENIFAGLNDIDILLDCFPHSGGTMLFDALWMGVPFVTLTSRPPVGRIGTTLMMNLELPEWIATDHDDYIHKATILAKNTQNLAQLRSGMRKRMQNSPLMDGPGFARSVEVAFRNMYQKWANS